MKSRKKMFGRISLGAGLVMMAGGVLDWGGIILPGIYQVLLVLLFPVFVLSLGLWWMARDHEADIPFLGY